MIRVKIEMCPLGDESRPEEIGRMYIANTSRHADPSRGDYDVAVCRRGTSSVPRPLNPNGNGATRSGSVKNYPKLSYNVWRLICRALKACFPEEGQTRESGEPYLDKQVLTGMQKIGQFLHYLPNDSSLKLDEDVQAALRWVRAAKDDPEPPSID